MADPTACSGSKRADARDDGVAGLGHPVVVVGARALPRAARDERDRQPRLPARRLPPDPLAVAGDAQADSRPSRGAGSPGPQVLAAVNTTADSALLYRQLEQRRDGLLGPCLHLSTTIVDRHLR